jgi:hypothetical protein
MVIACEGLPFYFFLSRISGGPVNHCDIVVSVCLEASSA